jgi:hypothetical protein
VFRSGRMAFCRGLCVVLLGGRWDQTPQNGLVQNSADR